MPIRLDDRQINALERRIDGAVLALGLDTEQHIRLLALLFPERYAEPPPPKAPLDLLPGTVGEVEARRARAAAGQALRHPEDAQPNGRRAIRADGHGRHARRRTVEE